MIKCPIAIGELFDKLSILQIKLENISEAEHLAHISKEETLMTALFLPFKTDEQLSKLFSELKSVNKQIWDNETLKRELDQRSSFGSDFIEANKLSYKLNDERAKLKLKINVLSNSEIVEFKSHKTIKY
jgi:tRNA A37 threonylcarbamoyltransferase TsaD